MFWLRLTKMRNMKALTGKSPSKNAGRRGHRRRMLKKTIDRVTSEKLTFAIRRLTEDGALTGARTRRLSARVDPGLIEAARLKTGFSNDSDLINAALAVIAAPDDFGTWFAAQADRLPKEFKLEL